MKKSTLSLTCFLFFAVQTIFATVHTIAPSGFTWSPATTNAAVGDTISIAGSTTHPAVQVDQTTWNANSATPLGSGWGVKTSTYTFTITSATDIYFVCQNHVASMGMKGMINVAGAGINPLNVSYNVDLFPNPATNGEFTIKAEGYTGNNGKVFLYNTEGQILESYNLTSVATVIKTKLAAGTYFYNVIINQKDVRKGKFVITSSK